MQLEAKNVSFRYDSHSPFILENESFSVKTGEVVGIVAPSGYGKSTLAMLLAGYYAPTSGEILLDGAPLPKRGVCPVQLIYQHPEQAINPRWRLRRVLEESGRLDEAALASFGIEQEWLERYPRELSGGELQRFCVARALMSHMPFLICDEISTMLDVITQAQIWNRILADARERSLGIITVTHNPELAKRICTRIYDLQNKSYVNLS